jgi:ribosomal protein S27E
MRQQNITCCNCGKFILTEQEQENTGNIKCIKGRYEDGFYDEAKDVFYCKECAKKLGKK